MPPPTLRLNTVLVTDDGPRYLVERKLAAGGFGTTYVGHRVSKSGRVMALPPVCIKVCTSRRDWHGEAFFGELLAGDPRVVRLRDAMVRTTGVGASQRRKYILIFDFMEGGTLADAVTRGAGANEGLKLFVTRERLRRGQAIRVISDAQFQRLVRAVRVG